MESTTSTSTKYDVVLAASSSAHSREALARVARSTVPGGRVYVYEDAYSSEASSSTVSTRLEALIKDLLLSGFTEAQELGANSSGSTRPAVWVAAKLPAWGLGASAKLSLKRPAAAVPPAAAAAAAAPEAEAAHPATAAAVAGSNVGGAGGAGVWKLAASGDDTFGQEDEDEELLDDDLLLTAEDKKPSGPAMPDDCEVGQSGRKACKNCSCGRAEAEAAAESTGVKLSADMLDNPQSACGNCYLGDAFRCGTCPYRGLPAFEPGQKITLGANMLAADV